MGCDIHVVFEKRTPEGWDLLFTPKPSEWWYEPIAQARVSIGATFVLTAQPIENWDDEDKAYEAAEAYLKAVPEEEVVARFGNDPDFQWDFGLPVSNRLGLREIDTRDYRWFSAIAGGLRGRDEDDEFPPRGIPNDLSWRVARWIEQSESDGHSHSWLMVREILDSPRLTNFPQWRWLTQHIPDPDNTRMVFFFDN